MKKKITSLALIISMFLFAAVFAVSFDSCKKKKTEPENTVPTHDDPWSPEPENGELPEEVLPAELRDVVGEYFRIYSGDNPAPVSGGFLSRPHALIATSLDTNYTNKYEYYKENYPDSIEYFFDRYLFFERTTIGLTNFFGKQQYDSVFENGQWKPLYDLEAKYQLNSVGEGDNFTCYYLTDGAPNGLYALQSTIFSGKWDPSYGGIKDFQVAVILLETSGNPNLDPKNSYRVLGDFDGLAQDTNWMDKKAVMNNDVKVSEHDAFWMFRKK